MVCAYFVLGLLSDAGGEYVGKKTPGSIVMTVTRRNKLTAACIKVLEVPQLESAFWHVQEKHKIVSIQAMELLQDSRFGAIAFVFGRYFLYQRTLDMSKWIQT